MIVLAVTALACAGAVGAWAVDRRRTGRRNDAGRCGICGVSWAETRSIDAYLIHGRLICEDCAQTARRRTLWELGGLGAWGAVLAGSALTVAPELGLFVGASTGIGLWATVRRMKRANLREQERIALGQSAGFDAVLRAQVAADPTTALGRPAV
jgi:hypothetical protein